MTMRDDSWVDTLVHQHQHADGSVAYDERDADVVNVFTEPGDHVVTLARYESTGRWVDVDPSEVTGETLLWCDVDTYLRENLVN